jgi:large conductance mechanosensitive channel
MSSTNQPQFRQGLGRAGGYAKNTLGGFRTFILRGNVVDLAIGIVIGAAFTSVVTAIVKDIITPLIPVPNGSLANLKVPVSYNPNAVVNFGDFINAVISFLIVAFVIYFFVVRPMTALLARYKPKEVEVAHTTRDCPYCLQSIPLLATRCAYCTSPVSPVGMEARAATAPANQQGQMPRDRS